MEKKTKNIDHLTDKEFDELIYAAIEKHETAIERELMEQGCDLDTTELQSHILRNINKAQHKRRAMDALHSAVQLYKNIAALFVFVFIATVLLIGTVGAARDSVFSWITDITGERVRFNEASSPRLSEVIQDVLLFPEEWHDFYVPARLPAGFRLSVYFVGSFQKTIIYQDSGGQKITFVQGDREETFLAGDNENAATEEIFVSGYSAMATEKDGLISIFWRTEERAFGLNGNASLVELIQIADSLRKIE